MVETGAQKRKAEDTTAALASDTLGEAAAEPAAKRVKSEDDEAPATSVPAATDNGTSSTHNEILATAVDVKQEDSSAVPIKAEETTELEGAEPDGIDAEALPGSSAATQDSDQPQTLGYKTFTTGATAFQYFHELINDLRNDQDVNEYEYKALLDLIKKGHPDAETKVGPGIRAFQVREHEEMTSTCFYLLREDGTEDNFSVRKCVCNLFPKWGENNARKPHDFTSRGGGRQGRGGRGGRGGGGRSSGGRGRGGCRGRGRGRGRG